VLQEKSAEQLATNLKDCHPFLGKNNCTHQNVLISTDSNTCLEVYNREQDYDIVNGRKVYMHDIAPVLKKLHGKAEYEDLEFWAPGEGLHQVFWCSSVATVSFEEKKNSKYRTSTLGPNILFKSKNQTLDIFKLNNTEVVGENLQYMHSDAMLIFHDEKSPMSLLQRCQLERVKAIARNFGGRREQFNGLYRNDDGSIPEVLQDIRYWHLSSLRAPVIMPWPLGRL
jgi:hypothetical protein